MRLGDRLNFDCGCDDRKFVMFEAGKLGLTEAAILAVAVSSIAIAWRLK